MQNEIQVGRFNAILSKLLGITGPPAPTSATDVFPTLTLESDRPEWHFLAGSRIAAATTVDAAVAGQYSHAGIVNPAGSGTLVIVRLITAYPTGTCELVFGISAATTPDAYTSSVKLDTRSWGTSHAPTTKSWIYTNAGAISADQFASVAGAASANYALTPPLGIVLSPGYQTFIRPSVVNIGIRAGWLFYERPLEASETR